MTQETIDKIMGMDRNTMLNTLVKKEQEIELLKRAVLPRSSLIDLESIMEERCIDRVDTEMRRAHEMLREIRSAKQALSELDAASEQDHPQLNTNDTLYRIVKFRDTLEDNPKMNYGLLSPDGDVICFCCGGTLEQGDYEILEDLGHPGYLNDMMKETDF